MIALLWSTLAHADEPAADDVAPAQNESVWADTSGAHLAPDVVPRPATPETGLKFLGLSDTKLSINNLTTTSALVNGQIIGTLGGLNATTVQKAAGDYVEQRVDGFFTYRPKVLDGKAALIAGFEVDFAWGDSSYSIGGNTGGAIGGDNVNLQTRRLETRFSLWKNAATVVGLQFVHDGVADPEASRLDDLTRSGGKLMFMGTEAAGVTVYGAALDKRASWKVGGYTLAELGFSDPDDLTLWMADGQIKAALNTNVGAHFWYLRDRAGGQAGVLGSGPTSALSEMQGGPRLALGSGDTAPETSAALAWGAVDVGVNHALTAGPLGATAMFVANFGRLYVTDEPDVNVLGFLGDAEVRLRYAPGSGSVARIEALVVSGSAEDPRTTGTYHGVITGNSYGIAATAWSTHGCLLLFPDPLSINRSVAAEYDVSGAGAGMVAGMAQVGYDIVPERLNASVGGGVAMHPAVADSGLTSEVNARLIGKPLPLLSVGLYGGALLGAHPPGEGTFDAVPWQIYTAVDWVVF